MTEQTDQQVLSELREMRKAQTETNIRLERVETALAGRIDTDATPGLLSRVPNIEARVAEIEARAEWMQRQVWIAFAGIFVTVIGGIIATALT